MKASALAKEFLKILEQMKRTGFSDPQQGLIRSDYLVLQYVSKRKNTTPTEISKELAVTTSRATVVIKNLEKKQLITRSTDPSDLRRFVINLSKKGKEYLTQQEDMQLKAITDMMLYLGQEDSKEYIRIMSKLAKRNNRVGDTNYE